MSKPTYLAYFAGGDLAGCGLRAAGYAPDTLVELDGRTWDEMPVERFAARRQAV